MSTETHELSTRARGHGEFLKLWESNAPLTSKELQLCSQIETEYSSLPFMPSSHSDEQVDSEGESHSKIELDSDDSATAYKGQDGLKGLASVTTTEEFHLWHDEMERRLQDANEEKYRALIGDLNRDRDAVAGLLNLVDRAKKALEDVRDGRVFVDEVISKFKSECENMVSERKKMGELADALRKRLTYFEELETLTVKFGGGPTSITPNHEDFIKLLHRLDECVAYASSSTGAVAEADGYLARFLDLQRRAFSSIRDHTVTMLRATASQVSKELREDRFSGAGFRHADLTDASKEYLRFRTVAPRVKLLMTELRARGKPKENIKGPSTPAHNRTRTTDLNSRYPRSAVSVGPYGNSSSVQLSADSGGFANTSRNTALQYYSECEECFFDERKQLLEPSVSAHVKSLADVKNMIALARLGSAYVLRVCQLERQLYEHFFPADKMEGDENPLLLSSLRSLCDMVYTELRPQILQEDDLDKLVYLIEVLKTEILGDEVPRRGFAGKAFAPSATRAIADAQERIIYRAEVFMRDEIRGFVPLPEHLNYPERILQHHNRTAEGRRNTPRKNSIPGTAENEKEADHTENLTPKPQASNGRSMGIYATWYPPVERTLRLLSMLYRCVEGEVFAGVAQEAVALCVQSVGSAAARIAFTDKESAEDHAQLFLIWQLLMTREQISPFDVEMSYTEHELDFVELRSLLGSVIRGQVSARSLASRPTIRERVVDSKRDLDHGVRGACEAFILKTTRLLLDPLLSFLAKCNALPATGRRDPDVGPGPSPTKSSAFDSLKRNQGSFAHPKRVKEMWVNVKMAIEKELLAIVERMKIYITKAASRGVLLRPIRANIAEAATELLSVLQLRYTLEEREEIGINGEEVEQTLQEVDKVTGAIGSTPRTRATSK